MKSEKAGMKSRLEEEQERKKRAQKQKEQVPDFSPKIFEKALTSARPKTVLNAEKPKKEELGDFEEMRKRILQEFVKPLEKQMKKR